MCVLFSLETVMLIDSLLCNVFLYRHQQLTMLLNRYINEPRDHKPRDSNSENFSNVNLTIGSKRILVFLLVIYFVFLFSSLLLDTVLPNPGWRCHPVDSGHVGKLWRNLLLFAFPLAGQKHLLTVPPHHHIPEVFKNNIFPLWKVSRFD